MTYDRQRFTVSIRRRPHDNGGKILKDLRQQRGDVVLALGGLMIVHSDGVE
jgi:hypothetical protein